MNSLLTRTTRLAVLALVSFIVTACGPTQGYPGPERPDGETALVVPSSDEDIAIEVGEYDFRYRGIRLLPGVHVFRVAYSYKDAPYDCETSHEFNYYAHERCLKERDKQIRKNESYVQECYTDDFYDDYEECKVPYFDSKCSLKARLEAGRTYDLTFGLRGNSGSPSFAM